MKWYTTTKRMLVGYDWQTVDTIRVSDARMWLDEIESVDPDAPSKLNPIFTRGHAIGMMRAALKGKEDGDTLHPLIAKNVLRLVQRRKRIRKP